jgi:small subunit ribosomal protein S5
MTDEKITATEENKVTETSETKKDNGRNRGRGRGNRRDNRKKNEAKEFEESIIQISRVTRVVKGGRRMRFRIAVVIGDKKGRVGFGVGKSSEVLGGIQKAVFAAKKNLIKISINKDTGSIPHEIKGKFKASQVLLFPAPEGKGIIAGGAVRKILELSGVKNVLSKIHGSRNRLNTTMATLDALMNLADFKNPGTKDIEKKGDKKGEVEKKTEKNKEDKNEVKAGEKPAKKSINKK